LRASLQDHQIFALLAKPTFYHARLGIDLLPGDARQLRELEQVLHLLQKASSMACTTFHYQAPSIKHLFVFQSDSHRERLPFRREEIDSRAALSDPDLHGG
jgi:hypothetical protein